MAGESAIDALLGDAVRPPYCWTCGTFFGIGRWRAGWLNCRTCTTVHPRRRAQRCITCLEQLDPERAYPNAYCEPHFGDYKRKIRDASRERRNHRARELRQERRCVAR